MQEEEGRLIDMDQVTRLAVERVENSGIVFLDEIDKIAGREGGHGPDVSREGVQRDILPIVEGTTVNTRYGMVRTDYILFIAAGAFHVSKPSDLIPELQGRFPIRVELQSLTVEDFVRILTEPKSSLVRQYTALLETEGLKLEFTPEAIEEMAQFAFRVNETTENIGARRLHTIMERVLDEISFLAPDLTRAQPKGDQKDQRHGGRAGRGGRRHNGAAARYRARDAEGDGEGDGDRPGICAPDGCGHREEPGFFAVYFVGRQRPNVVATTVRSFCKINLGLAIGPVRADGFHALTTCYQTLEAHDRVTVEARPAADTSLRITSNDERVPADSTQYSVEDGRAGAGALGAPLKCKSISRNAFPSRAGWGRVRRTPSQP